MTMRGSYQNRVLENKQFVEEIKVGTGMTEYHYTDRDAYEVIEVRDQKHITVRKYDHKPMHADQFGSNDWELVSNENNPTMEMVKRGNYWYGVATLTNEEYDSLDDWGKLRACVAGFDPQKIAEKGKQTKYYKHNVSFGVAEYYYDYSF